MNDILSAASNGLIVEQENNIYPEIKNCIPNSYHYLSKIKSITNNQTGYGSNLEIKDNEIKNEAHAFLNKEDAITNAFQSNLRQNNQNDITHKNDSTSLHSTPIQSILKNSLNLVY